MKNLKTILMGNAAAVAFLCACNTAPQPAEVQLTKSGINPADYDTCIAVTYDAATRKFAADTTDAKPVKLYTLTNKNGMEVCITNFGGRIVSIMVPNKDGEFVDVACGFDKVENYFPWNFETDFGCSVGRYANRINNGEYTYDGTTDAPTVLNMTNHTYFNLSGDLNNTIDESILTVNADNYTPGDNHLIPTGEIKPVEGTVFDFRTPKAIGADFDKNDPEMVSVGGGYDHNWVLNTKGNQDEIAVTMTDPRSGIKMDMYTNEPGVQCYSANFQDGTRPGKGGIMYQKHCAICLESQKFPDSPNKCMMPGWELSNPFITPEKPYHSYCKYVFSVEK